jgi:hypothetical protein
MRLGISLGTKKQLFASTDEQFSNFGRSEQPKRGVLAGVFSKLKLNFLSNFDKIFLQEVIYFLGDPKTIFCPN